ncbi:MAG TPA: hypothetical protein VG225_03620 [Terracidiphilus sp.]|jgi:hypothetical protein|nr:hypothetical protein [Terracidiphilus sp.]
MRWLMIALLVSLVAMLIASAGLAHHIWREHARRRAQPPAPEKTDRADTEEAP